MRDPYRQIEVLQQALSSDKSRIAFILGAGCPVSVQTNEGQPLIPNIEGLTKLVCTNLAGKGINEIVERISVPPGKTISVEDILSHIRLLIEVVGSSTIGSFAKGSLEDLEKEICIEISMAVNKELPNSATPYHKLALWIRSIHRNHSIEIFTPNYDLLVESALESKGIPYFDGFIGSKEAFFDLHAIEHEALPPRWAKLWKLHGSINWWNDSDHRVFRGHSQSKTTKQMIYPSHLKYDQSRRMPYLAMQDRLGHFLATGQAIVVTCGYSFVDQHLNAILMQRLAANPRAICFGLLYDQLEKYPEAAECAVKTPNICLLARDGAFIGGQRRTWSNSAPHSTSMDFCIHEAEGEGGKKGSVTCSIGDFAVLGDLLLNQAGYIDSAEGENKNAG